MMWSIKTESVILRTGLWFYLALLSLASLSAYATAAQPIIFEGGIVNAASFASHPAPLAPGSMAVIFGTNLNDGSVITSGSYSQDGKLENTLAGTTVRFDGIPAPVFYSVHGVEYDQVCVQVPFELAGRSSVRVEVTLNGQTSAPRTLSLAQAAPGVFTLTQDGKGRALLLHQDGISLVTDESPARQGEVVILYATGLGLLSPPVRTGAPSTTNSAVSSISVTVGGIRAAVDYAGGAPGFAGLNQINFRIPETVVGGSEVDIRLVAGNADSNSVTAEISPLPPVYSDIGALFVGARDVAYDPFRNLIYAGTAAATKDGDPITTPLEPNAILIIDPRSRSVLATIPCGSSPHRLALSANGRYLWIALDVDQAIQRINLETKLIEFTVPFRDIYPRSSSLPLKVATMRPHPSNDETLALSWSNQSSRMVVLDGPRRSAVGPYTAYMVFNEDGTIWTERERVGIGSGNVEILESIPSGAADVHVMLPFAGKILSADGALYSPRDLNLIGGLFTDSDSHVDYSVYLPQTGFIYSGGGGSGQLGFYVYDPVRMIRVGEFIVRTSSLPFDVRPFGQNAERFASIGPEGFVLVFGDGDWRIRGEGGGPILFLPNSRISWYAALLLPESQPANGEVRRIRLPATAASIDFHTGQVYLSLPPHMRSLGNSLLPFDPRSGSFGGPIWVGSAPGVSVITPDHRYLYVALLGALSVKRFRLPEFQPDLEFPSRTVGGRSIAPTTLLSVPGAPSTTIAVLGKYLDRFYGFLGDNPAAIYDNGIPRPKRTSVYNGEHYLVPGLESSHVSSMQFSASGDYLFAINGETSAFDFTRWRVTPEGFEGDAGKLGLSAGFGAQLKCADTLCVTSRGLLFDPIGMERIRMFGGASLDSRSGSFTNLDLMALDATNDRVYFNDTIGQGPGIRAYQVSTGNLLGTLPGEFYGSEMQLLPSGELMVTGGGEVILIPTSLIR